MRYLPITVLLLLASCAAQDTAPMAATEPAEDRYLSKEQDDRFRELCASEGCAVVPLPTMQKLLKRLESTGA